MSLAVDAPEVASEPEFPGLPSRDLPVWMNRVSKWYGPVIGVNELSLRVEGGIVAILGPNGAGKSTLIRLLTGQLRPNIGHLRIFGRSVRAPAARAAIGYCPDVDAFYEEMTGAEFVVAMLRLAGFSRAEAKARAADALATVGMEDAAGRRMASKPLRGCSKGMRQRIKLAQAVAHDPQLLILDEPMSGLDPVGRRDFFRLFRSFADQGKTLLISSHLLGEMEELADSVVLISQGRALTQGTWRQVAAYLSHLPQPVLIEADQVRELAAELLTWPGVLDVHFKGERECVITSRDPAGLCKAIGQLVTRKGFRVARLHAHDEWAGTLFELAARS